MPFLLLFVSVVAITARATNLSPLGTPRPCGAASDVTADTTIDATVQPPSPLIRFRANDGPSYPPLLRDRGVEGKVRATFVFDTSGRVVPGSAYVLAESHPEFGAAVCTFLRRAAFTPARIDGHRRSVRVVGMGFRFSLGRRPSE